MRILLIETVVTNIHLGQLQGDLPKLKGKITYDSQTNEVIVADEVTLSQAEVTQIQNHVFDMSRPAPKYNPNKCITFVKLKELVRAKLGPMVGTAPTIMSDLDYIGARGGLDSGGLVMPLDDWISYTPFEQKIMGLLAYST